MQRSDYECKFCRRGFVLESRLLKHVCPIKKKYNRLHSIEGQSAWQYYQIWMTCNSRKVQAIDLFVKSRFFMTFIRFAQFTVQVNMPDIKQFIALVSRQNIPPILWTNEETYAMYLHYMDSQYSPLLQVSTSLKTILHLADQLNCATDQVLSTIPIAQIVLLIKQRKLSPWFLLLSKSFRDVLQKNVNDYQIQMLEQIIDADRWTHTFQKYPKIVKQVKKIVIEAGV